MCVLVEAITDLCGGDKKLERIIDVAIKEPFFLEFLDLFHASLLVGGEAEFFFVAPKYGGFCFEVHLVEQVMDVHNLFFSSVAYDNKETSLS